jgi:hypothetical protein
MCASRGEPCRREPVRAAFADLAENDSALPPGRVRRVGQLRVPLTLTCRPVANLYVLPDGRRLWTVRLWSIDRPVTRVVRTEVLRDYARRNRLRAMEHEIDELLRRGDDALR